MVGGDRTLNPNLGYWLYAAVHRNASNAAVIPRVKDLPPKEKV
jgi:hypothetical protein